MNTKPEPVRHGAVLVVDVAASSSAPDFPAIRDRNMRALSELHLEKRWIGRPYTVTAWDEFQTLSWRWQELPHILFDIRRIFAPWDLYIGIGYGAVSGWRSKKPINEALSGEAFERARLAMDALKSGKGDKFRRLSQFATGQADRDELLNLIYDLHDTLLQQISSRQWEMIAAAATTTTQEAVAEAYGIDPSTVTRILKRGHYWQIMKTLSVVARQMARGRLALEAAIS